MAVQRKEKTVYYELLRIIAILCVVFNHTAGFYSFTYADFGSWAWFVRLLVSLFSKIGVPVFFMISGALLLNRDRSLSWLLSRVVHTGLQLAAITALIMVGKYFVYGVRPTLKSYIIFLYTGTKLSSQLWFMYAYLAFLLSIPLLDRFVKNFDRVGMRYLIFCYVISQIALIAQYVFLNDKYSFNSRLFPTWMATDIFLYPVIGWYLAKHPEETTRRRVAVWTISAGLFIALLCGTVYLMGYRNGGSMEDLNYQRFHNYFVLFPSVAVFLIVQKLDAHIPPKLYPVIRVLGGASFGVYMIHILVKDLPFMKRGLDYLSNSLGMDHLLSNILYVVAAWLLSTFFVVIYQTIVRLLSECIRKIRNQKLS
ncbi:MAG: acyltransferase [Firmicutes bacterium]|nr:acyltransferase [Bacillota bacterium]